jgi:excisionase family DNA binding protein
LDAELMPPETSPDELLSTGQVAKILGTTVRHVVNLCLRGELPYSMVGTHRRVKRSDAEALAGRAAGNAGGPMTRDQLRTLWLHRAVAGKIAADPAPILANAEATARELLAREPAGAPWLRQWLSVIDRGPEAVMRTLVSTDPLARELRANSPFAGSLTAGEREAILASFARAGTSISRR